jgi:hypothetical protein
VHPTVKALASKLKSGEKAFPVDKRVLKALRTVCRGEEEVAALLNQKAKTKLDKVRARGLSQLCE